MTAEEHALTAAVLAAPADDLPRLVFADWLDEHGEAARAQFIREECELPTLPPGSRRRAELFGRHALVLKAYAREWFPDFVRPGVTFRTARGFVEAVTTGPAEMAADADAWFAAQPVTRLKLTGVSVWSGGRQVWYHRGLFTSPLLGRLDALDLSAARVNSAGVYFLAKNPALGSLTELTLRGNMIDDEGAATLAGMPALRGLRSLDLAHNPIRDRGAWAVARSDVLGGLESLWMGNDRIGPAPWRALEERFGRVLVG